MLGCRQWTFYMLLLPSALGREQDAAHFWLALLLNWASPRASPWKSSPSNTFANPNNNSRDNLSSSHPVSPTTRPLSTLSAARRRRSSSLPQLLNVAAAASQETSVGDGGWESQRPHAAERAGDGDAGDGEDDDVLPPRRRSRPRARQHRRPRPREGPPRRLGREPRVPRHQRGPGISLDPLAPPLVLIPCFPI